MPAKKFSAAAFGGEKIIEYLFRVFQSLAVDAVTDSGAFDITPDQSRLF